MCTYTIDVDIPRDPAEYEPTDHFHYRFNHRTDPEITGDVVNTCITDGEIKTTADPERRIFEADIDGVTWWLVVKFVDAAFYRDEPHHLVLTAYAPEHHEETSYEHWEG